MLLIIAEADARLSSALDWRSYNTYRTLLNTGYSIGNVTNGVASLWDIKALLFKYSNYVATDFAAGGAREKRERNTNWSKCFT
jgi:hypothetical protein